MKARGIALLVGVLFVMALPAHAGHVGMGAGLSGGYWAAAEWETDTHRVFVGFGNRGRVITSTEPLEESPADTILYVSVFKKGPSSVPVVLIRSTVAASHPDGYPVCDRATKMTTDQWTIDPALATASVTNVATACGKVSVSWRAVAPPTASLATSYDLPGGGFFFTSYTGAGVGASVTRPATAAGWVGAMKLDDGNLVGATIGVGAGAGAWATDYDVTYEARAFRAVGGEVSRNGTYASFHVVDYALTATGGASDHVRAAAAVPARACATLAVQRRVGGRLRTEADRACGVVTLDMDPALNSAHVTGTIGSLVIDLTFTASGTLTPEPSAETPEVDGTNLPYEIVDAEAYVSRTATNTGTIRSRRLNTSTRPQFADALLCEGVHALIFRGYPYFYEY